MSEELIAAARAAQEAAYAPHSQFRVGAALRFADGTVITGSNVENASYGLSLCAETVAVAKAFSDGRRGGLVEVAVTASGPDVVTPCGRCRQVLHEFGGGMVAEIDQPRRVPNVSGHQDGGCDQGQERGAITHPGLGHEECHGGAPAGDRQPEELEGGGRHRAPVSTMSIRRG